MDVGSAKVRGGGHSVDAPRGPRPPPPEGYGMAPAPRHMTSKRSGREGDGANGRVKKRNAPPERETTALVLYRGGGAEIS